MSWVIDNIKEGIVDVAKWIGLGILNGVINSSEWVCLFICMTALFLYIGGMKKAGKFVPISFIIFYILQSLKLVIKE